MPLEGEEVEDGAEEFAGRTPPIPKAASPEEQDLHEATGHTMKKHLS